MLSKEKLLELLTSPRERNWVDKISNEINKTADCNSTFKNLIDLTFYPDKQVGFRAAWVMETTWLMQPEHYQNELALLVQQVKNVTNPGCKRHYARVMMQATSVKAPLKVRQQVEAMDMEPVVEQCFDWMIDPKVLVAVKVFSAETLCNLRHRYEWITGELADQLKHLMKDGSPAIQSAGRRLLKKLSPQKVGA